MEKQPQLIFYTANVERAFQLDNGYFLLYLHKPQFYTMFLLYLRYLGPIALLIYLIKRNPFYVIFPAMLPIMMISLIAFIVFMVRYSHKTNLMIQQILMDPTGTQLTFVFQNQFLRRFRGDEREITLSLE